MTGSSASKDGMTTTVVVGNPKKASRTRDAAIRTAAALTGTDPDIVIELADLGPKLLAWGDPDVGLAVEAVSGSDLLVVASPTYKATYTGLLKLFLDQFAGGSGLAGVVCVPLMLGAGLAHALAGEVALRSVLAELGGTCAVPALYLLESSYGDGAIEAYAVRWRPVVNALIGVGATEA